MVFSSLLFVFFFLTLVVILYFLAKEKYRNYILLVASLLFYSYGEPRFVYVMIASILLNYILACWIDHQKKKENIVFARNLLLLDITANLGLLFVFKYLNFFNDIVNSILHVNISNKNIALPIGISFFTFQALSYVIDVYRGKVTVQKNPLYVALYISFFPQLVAGPIVRYSTIEQQMSRRECTLEKFGEGGRRFLLGFSKKVILANNLSVVASRGFGLSDSLDTANPLMLWVSAISFSLQIYYDFSGYSDMAIGLGKIFGFEFEENFNYPYISKTVTEFWRRWHISLGQFFRDYVYIPLGGARVSAPRHLLNLFVVWALTGIWHGANFTFIVWGVGYFVLLLLEKYLIKPEKRGAVFGCLWRIVTLLCINFGWVLFNSTDVRTGIRYCLAMMGYYRQEFVIDSNVIYYFREYGFFIIVGLVFSTPILGFISERMDRNNKASYLKAVFSPVCYGLVFLWAVSFLILGAHNPFIYFNF